MEPHAGLDQRTALVNRFFTSADVDPFSEIEWERRDAWPNVEKYHRSDLEVPRSWSQNALDITSKLYLAKGASHTETSIRELIERVAHKITCEGIRAGYFEGGGSGNGASEPFTADKRSWGDDARVFYDELRHILVNQLAAFNSPVWFNVGRPDRPQQVSACFILSVDDSTDSIMSTARREAFIFKGGSGSGFDVSRLRGSMEPLSTGGTASGPVSFMRMWDAGAGTFKSGGTTRRAAKLVKCDVDHPDIRDFVICKAREEQRLRQLAAAGVHIGMDEEGERNVAECTSYQNANNSVGVPDDFMERAIGIGRHPREWPLIARKTGEITEKIDAVELLDLIAQSAWECACPGMQFMDTINRWHTTPMLDGELSPIRSSNPCGEYLSNDDTSCNLASINVLKFVRQEEGEDGIEGGPFDVESYRHVVDVMTTAMDILVEFADFPNDDVAITERTRKMRQLGLGYSNMGAAIMAQGMAYDSDAARDFAASVTALNTGRAYRQSALVAERMGPFHYFDENRANMLEVIDEHARHVEPDGAGQLWAAAEMDWMQAREFGQEHGFRNAQASVLAPAGSISYLMDCDTTGIEPSFELVSHKDLAGGGHMTLINQSVRRALYSLGYQVTQVEKAATLLEEDYDRFLNYLEPEHRPVFHGANQVPWQGHIKMLAAVQPFVSGGISKTINMPESATTEDIRDAYVMAWQLGVKDLALYRNNSKVRQVLMAKPKVDVPVPETIGDIIDMEKMLAGGDDNATDERGESSAPPEPVRRRLPRTRQSVTHKISVRSADGITREGYVMAGMYADGSLGEIFLEGFGKQGGFVQNALSAWVTDASVSFQYGVPLEVWCRKHAYMSDETGGQVEFDPDDPPILNRCFSIVDYVARWIAGTFGDDDLAEELGVMTNAVKARKAAALDGTPLQTELAVGTDFGLTGPVTAVGEMVDGKLTNVSIIERIEPFLEELVIFTTSNGSGNGNGHAREMISGPPCDQCGSTMHRAGACWQCRCGASTGCG